jgi:dihydroorotate dehydrogenase (fumarate)
MADLTTSYMGLKLKNPLLVASCSLSKNLDGVRRLADSGAGGIVLKSLFEEQIQKEIVEDLEKGVGPTWHTEAYDYVSRMGMELGPQEYLELVGKAKKLVPVPVIASLNCVSPHWWKDFAKQIELSGADALELNVSYGATDAARSGGEIEANYYAVLDRVKQTVTIPVAVKIGPYFSALAMVASELSRRGASALVLFNRYYQFDVDVEKKKIVAANPMSSPGEMHLSLRWIAQLAGRVNCDLAATTGIHDGVSVLKQIMVGAKVAQVCSVLYEKGTGQIKKMLDAVNKWLDRHGHPSVDSIRGVLSQKESEKPELYERLQYIKALVGVE